MHLNLLILELNLCSLRKLNLCLRPLSLCLRLLHQVPNLYILIHHLHPLHHWLLDIRGLLHIPVIGPSILERPQFIFHAHHQPLIHVALSPHFHPVIDIYIDLVEVVYILEVIFDDFRLVILVLVIQHRQGVLLLVRLIILIEMVIVYLVLLGLDVGIVI